jgi:hypothetical protein
MSNPASVIRTLFLNSSGIISADLQPRNPLKTLVCPGDTCAKSMQLHQQLGKSAKDKPSLQATFFMSSVSKETALRLCFVTVRSAVQGPRVAT